MGNEQSASEEPTQTDEVPEKHENGSVNGLAEVSAEAMLEKNGVPLVLSLPPEPTGTNQETEPGEGGAPPKEEQGGEQVDAPVVNNVPEKAEKQEEVKKSKGEKTSRFGKMFKIKSHQKKVPEEESSGGGAAGPSPPGAGPEQDSGPLKPEPPASAQQESPTAQPRPQEEAAPQSQEEPEAQEEEPQENPVMNFFKTLVTPTRPTKKSPAAPQATKDQSEKEPQPESSSVAQVSEPPAAPKGMGVPPPPPPEPPKMEAKGEASAKAAKTAPKEEAKSAGKEAESSKGKSAREALGWFFGAKRTKEPPQPEPVVPDAVIPELPVEADVGVQKVDPSKTGTLEAAKPEAPPPAQEKKPAKSGFMSMFKSKAADAKKTSPEVPAATEAAPPVKTKEEPKAAAKTSESTGESKAVGTAAQAGEEAPSAPKKLEKRNSIQLFFKILSQKRNSTDAGIQTDPLAPTAAEKSK